MAPRSPETCVCYLLLATQALVAALALVFWVQAGLALSGCHRHRNDGTGGAVLWWTVAVAAAGFPVALVMVLLSMGAVPQALGATGRDIESRLLRHGVCALVARWTGLAALLAAALGWSLRRCRGCFPRGGDCVVYGQCMVWVLVAALGVHAIQVLALRLRAARSAGPR